MLRSPLLCLLAILVPPLHAQRVTVATRALHAISANAAVDTGRLPVSEPLTLTIRLQPTPAQTAALDPLLAAQTNATSPAYHNWLTPQQYAAQFGPTDEQLATVTNYLQSQGLTVSSVSATRTRLTVTGTAGQAQQAFAVTLHRFTVDNTPHFANATEPALPAEVASLIAGISGLDDLPQPASARISVNLPKAPASARLQLAQSPSITAEGSATDSMTTIAEAIDANALPVLTLTTAACSADLTEADLAAYRALFRQASAQGITLVATSSCATGGSPSFPASLAEVTAITTAPRESTAASSSTGPSSDSRPDWQFAPGLPADGLRHEPDLTTTSAADFAQAITTLNQQTGGRLGNVNATLYALSKTPGLFTQPDAAPNTPPAGNWEPPTGLGLINLNTLLKVYPRTSGISTKTSLISSSYALNYGNPFTLTSNVQVTGVIPPVTPTTPYPPAPTGIVTFTASTQGVLGTSGIDGSGSAIPESFPWALTSSSPPTPETPTTHRPRAPATSPSPFRSSTPS